MLSLDMTGEDTAKTGGTFLIEKQADPSAVWVRPSDPHTEWGASQVKAESLKGSLLNDVHLAVAMRRAKDTKWVVRTNPYEGGSDHTAFAEAGVPSLLNWHFTDRYYHTNLDRPDKTSQAEMINVGVTVATTRVAAVLRRRARRHQRAATARGVGWRAPGARAQARCRARRGCERSRGGSSYGDGRYRRVEEVVRRGARQCEAAAGQRSIACARRQGCAGARGAQGAVITDGAQQALVELGRRINDARRVTILTGAGVSAASGVPTFRGSGGLWRTYRAEDLATPAAFHRNPELVWEWYDWRRGSIALCRPNPAHEVLARLSRRPGVTLITQNVDGLHELAGTDDVIRLHGSIWRLRCAVDCGGVPASWEDRRDAAAGTAAALPQLRRLARPGVVWFGEALDTGVLNRSIEATACDVYLSIGTSSLVLAGRRIRCPRQEPGRVHGGDQSGRDRRRALSRRRDCAASRSRSTCPGI